jgi:hypothetical protein
MTGTAKLVVYLLDIEDDKALEDIADKIAGILVVPEEDDNCRGIIAAEVWDAPADEDDLVREIGKNAQFLIIPSAESVS